MGSGKKGSQLAQLRSGLREAGVTAPRSKKGRGGDSDSRVGKYRAEPVSYTHLTLPTKV